MNQQRKPVVINLGNAGPSAALSGQNVTLVERTWLTRDRSEAVPDGHPDAAFLLGGEGDSIPIEEAERLGLLEEDEPEPEPKKKTPTNDKQRQPAHDK
jgi:hypothetical protein